MQDATFLRGYLAATKQLKDISKGRLKPAGNISVCLKNLQAKFKIEAILNDRHYLSESYRTSSLNSKLYNHDQMKISQIIRDRKKR